MNESLGNLLRRYRFNCGYSQQAVANALGVDRSTYSCYETEKSLPTLKTISMLKKMLNISYDEIFSCFDSTETSQNDDNHSATKEVILIDRDMPTKASIYELSQGEKQLVLYYRSLNTVEQKKFIKELQKLMKRN